MKILYLLLFILICMGSLKAELLKEKDKFKFSENGIIYSPSVKNAILEKTSELIPDGYYLGQFNSSQSIFEYPVYFSIPHNTCVRLSLLNILGEEITVLANNNIDAGTYKLLVDTGFLNSGMYVYRLQTENYTASGKMIIVK